MLKSRIAMEFKILFLIDTLGAGGAERSLAEMLPYFQRAGIIPSVIYLRETQEGVQRHVEEWGFRTRRLPKGSLLRQAAALRKRIDLECPALIHATLLRANLIGRLGAAGTGVPVLSSIVNTSYGPARLQNPQIKLWKLRLVQAADALTAHLLTAHFHAITEAVKEAAVRDLRIAPERITVVERGRDPERLGRPSAERRRQARRRLGLDDEDEVLLNVGRQDYQKGQCYALEAVAHLMEPRPRLKLLVAGRAGRATPALQRLATQMGLGERVRFLGHRSDIPDLLAAADLFVFPSLFEGLGGACIEAMATGLPVVCSDIPALQEVVGGEGGGLLVEPANAAALAQATGALLDDPERAAAMGRRGRERFEERFTLQRSAERMVELFRHVADVPKSTSRRSKATPTRVLE